MAAIQAKKFRIVVMPFILLFSLSFRLTAQVFPKEGSILNYRLIGFSFPGQENAVKYRVQIARANCSTVESFEKKITMTFNSTTNRFIETVPAFGSQYTWRVTYISGSRSSVKSPLYHFSTGTLPAVNTAAMRLRITNKAKKYKDAYILTDDVNVMYDMQGNPLWYLPVIKQEDSITLLARDIKLSPQGTITFLANMNIYEVNYDGKILWQGPEKGIINKKSTADYYHHQLTRLHNGRYMALVSPFSPAVENNNWENSDRATYSPRQRASFGSIAEYDSTGKVVWSWESFRYFRNFPPQQLESYFYDENKLVSSSVDVHLNAFFFDEKESVVYLSFKNISTILKVKYPEGNVLAAYGNLSQPSGAPVQNDLFCGQHSCNISMSGDLYLFNNNSCNSSSPPTVVTIKLPSTANDTLRKVWEYECSFSEKAPDGNGFSHFPATEDPAESNGKMVFTTKFTSGGNVFELPDRSMFISISGNSGRLLIVGPDRSILWSAVSERYASGDKKWLANEMYRVSIIPSPKDLEQLIWNSEK